MIKKFAQGFVIFGFIIFFLIMTGIMVKGFIEQKKDDKAEIERYESMITEGSKTVLTNAILEEDHDKYVEDCEKAKNTMISLLICFGGAFVSVVVGSIFLMIIRGIEDGPISSFAPVLVSFTGIMFVVAIVIVTVVNFLIPKFSSSHPEEDFYYFNELNIIKTEKREETITTGSGDSRTTETRVYYILYDENGKEIQVNEVFFNRVDEPGIYYVGQTVKGSVFSLYSGKYFELEKQ